MILAALSLLLSIATGVLLVELFWSRDRRGLEDIWLKLILGAGLGPGISGGLAFLVTILAGFSPKLLIGVDLAAFVLLAALVARRGLPSAPGLPRQGIANRGWLALWLPFVAMLAAEAYAFALVAKMLPQGAWDSWAFWDLRAKYLVQSPPDQWMRVFEATPGLIGFHPDYPPLFPFIIARSWSWGDTLAPGVTLAVATLYTFGVVALLVAALRPLTSLATALIAGMVLLGTPTFLQQGGWRIADVPLGWFMLATLALVTLAEARGEKSRGLLVLAGISCGLASLTKNEGVLFAAIAGGAWMVVTFLGGTGIPACRSSAGQTGMSDLPFKRRGRDIGAFAAGIAVPLAMLLYFKSRLAPGMDLLGPEGTKGELPWDSLDKHREIWSAFLQVFFSREYWCAFPWAMILALPLMGFRFPSHVRRAAIAGAVVVLLMLGGYYVVYARTHHEIAWLLSTTIFRLLVQVAPLMIFTAFLFARPPEEQDPSPRPSPPKTGARE